MTITFKFTKTPCKSCFQYKLSESYAVGQKHQRIATLRRSKATFFCTSHKDENLHIKKCFVLPNIHIASNNF